MCSDIQMLLTQAYHYNVSVSRRADHVFAETIPGSKMTRVPFWPFTWFFTLATFQWWIRSYTTVDINRSPDLPISHCRNEATEGRGGCTLALFPNFFPISPWSYSVWSWVFFWQIFSKIIFYIPALCKSFDYIWRDFKMVTEVKQN